MTTEPHTSTAFATGQPGSAELAIDPALVEQILTRFLRAEIHRTGFRRAVVGVSGGIDSSVVVALAARALGPENVLAVTMPYKTSSDGNPPRQPGDDRRSWACRSLDVPITDQIDAYFARLAGAAQMRLANKCARERMTILYDQSAAFEGLVLGTSNKSELLLGYGTQFGDMASAIESDRRSVQNPTAAPGRPFAGARRRFWQNRPAATCGSARPTKTSLGFSYAEVDRLLVLLVDRRWQADQLVRAGFAAEFVERVARLVRRNHYKRRLPIIAKLSERTVDRDFRYARDWGT